MEQENWEKVKEILQKALTLPLKERLSFLDNADLSAEVRAEVESLLEFEEEAENLMELPAVEFSRQFFADEAADSNQLIGQNIGHYRIIRELGYGGMGAVYLAERADGKFEQKVALKLLKREMNTLEIRRRFEQERKILASLEHPNIARLLDAGTTDDQIPFIAMEYVEGLPIDDYCNKHQFNLNQRLDLFQTVCHAVNFAHRNLIVHRDLKPSNILVNENGNPKLLDFGISKILSGEFENLNKSTVTKLGVMTPAYASPEQLQNKSVTTATDIYNLGTILYELLSGHRPFQEKESDFKEIYKAVIEIDPPPPSAVINSSAIDFKSQHKNEIKNRSKEINKNINSARTGAEEFRRTIPNKTYPDFSLLRGDLDNIILKSLRKEPERRYLSAENFAEDIKKYLRGLPVSARPNTFSYRAEKFFKRNKVAVIAGLFIILTIFAGTVATFWQARVAAAERDRARLEAEKSRKINEYMQRILNFSNPHWLSSNPERNSKATISEAIDESLKRIDVDLSNEPEIQAEILFTISQTFTSQGKYDIAEKHLRQAIEKFNQVSGAPNLKSMQASVILGDAMYLKGKYAEAKTLYLDAINYLRPIVEKDKSQLKWLVIALNDLGNIYVVESKFDEALKVTGESNKFAENIDDKDRYVVPIVMGNYGAVLAQTGDFSASLDYYKKAYDEMQKMGNGQSYEAGQLLNLLGRAYSQMDEFESADKSLKLGYDVLKTSVNEKNPFALSTSFNIAQNYYFQGKYKEAEEATVKNLKLQNEVYPQGHFLTALSQSLLGDIYTQKGKFKEGEEHIKTGLEILSKSFKEPNHFISQVKTSLGKNLIAQKRYAEAEEVLTSALDGFIKTRGENHPFTKQCREALSKIPK